MHRSIFLNAAQFLLAVISLIAGMAVVTTFFPEAGSLVLAFPALLTAKELREKRANLWEQEKEILERAKEDGLTSEDRETLDRIEQEDANLRADIERIERAEERAREMESGRGARTLEDGEGGTQPGGAGEGRGNDREARQLEALRAWLTDPDERTDEQRELLREERASGPNMRLRLMSADERDQYLRSRERRAQSVGTDADGGYTVPQGFRAVLEDAMLQFSGIRQTRASILRTASGNDIDIPTSDDTGNTGALLAENTQDSEQDIAFGQATLGAYKYTSRIIRVSKELLQDSAFNLGTWLPQKLGERIGRITAQHFTTGTGTNQPQGAVTGATSGVTAAAAAAVTFDEVLQLIHSVDPAYRMQAEFLFNDSTLLALKQLKDGNDRHLWVPGVAVREPDRLWGYRYHIAQEMPDMAASATPIVFGDFSKFMIRDVLDVTLVRMVERYADYHQVAFVAISRHDSVLVDAGTNPLKKLTMAAA